MTLAPRRVRTTSITPAEAATSRVMGADMPADPGLAGSSFAPNINVVDQAGTVPEGETERIASEAEIDRQRAIAQSFAAKANSNRDIKSVWQGLAHVADSALSGWNEKKADTAERERRDAMAKALGGMIDTAAMGPDSEKIRQLAALDPEGFGKSIVAMQLQRKLTPPAKPTSDIQEYQFAVTQGFDGTFAEYQQSMKKAGATSVDARQMGNIPPGYHVEYDAEGRPSRMSPIEGGPAYNEEAEAQKESESRARFEGPQAAGVVSTIRTLQNQLKGGKIQGPAGRVNVLHRKDGIFGPMVAGTETYNFVTSLQGLKDKIGIDQLMRIKAAGTGLGQVPQSQLESLGRSISSVDVGKSDEQIIFDLDRTMKLYNDIIEQSLKDVTDPTFRGVVEDIAKGRNPVPEGDGTGTAGSSPAPEGVDQEDWDNLTDEEKIKFNSLGAR